VAEPQAVAATAESERVGSERFAESKCMPNYFAYGSNMSHDQIRARCPSHKFICAAELSGYKLAFTRYSNKRKCGVADIVLAPEQSVWGAVFEVSDKDLATLDRHEGAHLSPPAYVRVQVRVTASDGFSLDAVTYEVLDKTVVRHVPNVEYLSLILDGARKWGLPQAYLETLRSFEGKSEL